ncbi:MAG: hypothetical protein OMM_12745, partial [Candidatus Magnetoglobus multicellularis str. Araruama]
MDGYLSGAENTPIHTEDYAYMYYYEYVFDNGSSSYTCHFSGQNIPQDIPNPCVAEGICHVDLSFNISQQDRSYDLYVDGVFVEKSNTAFGYTGPAWEVQLQYYGGVCYSRVFLSPGTYNITLTYRSEQHQLALSDFEIKQDT